MLPPPPSTPPLPPAGPLPSRPPSVDCNPLLDDVLLEDGLKEQLKAKQRQSNKYLGVAAKLLAPVVEQDIVAGFNVIAEMLRQGNYAGLATELEIAKALYFMRSKQFDKAIETLKSYEKKDQTLVAHAATNLSFIYFHEADYQNAVKCTPRLPRPDCAARAPTRRRTRMDAPIHLSRRRVPLNAARPSRPQTPTLR